MSSNFATKIVGANPAEKRSEMDFYPTPSEVTEALLQFLDLPKTTVIWEPACGEMDMVSTMQSAGYSVFATDLKYGQDFLTEPLPECDWIVTNPPFCVSDKFIERCVEHGKPFAMLLKSQYWHAKKRYDLFQSTPPVLCLSADLETRLPVQETRETEISADGCYVVRVGTRLLSDAIRAVAEAGRWAI